MTFSNILFLNSFYKIKKNYIFIKLKTNIFFSKFKNMIKTKAQPSSLGPQTGGTLWR
jgi:hypothetical protein